MYLTIVFLPLLGSAAAGLFGRYIGQKGACILTTGGVITACFLSCIAFYEVGICGAPVSIKLLSWFESEVFIADWGFQFDQLTACMLIVVTLVSSLVHLFSVDYIAHDPHRPRFMSYLSLFTFFMLSLITSDNFLQIFFGWEGVGLASFLLINFWFGRKTANAAAVKAFVMNRIGDFGFALGILGVFLVFRTLEFEAIFATVPLYVGQTITFFNFEVDILTCICILLFIGAVGKSSQIGLHTWLPDAMEGPTPVSALIHAATMVTAGIYIILRCSPLFEFAPNALMIVAFIGACTAFFAATTGLLQNDLKKVIAYSTCSQLGYMAFACGLSKYTVSFFHLANHAFFKALLFLSAGCIIHAMADEQEMRRMGGLLSGLPFTYTIMILGSLALMGIPFLSGFYSKDTILEFAAVHYQVTGSFTFWLGVLAALCTSFYSMRLIYLTFLNNSNGHRSSMEHLHDPAPIVIYALLPLAIGSLFSGYLGSDLTIGIGTPFWGNALYSGWTTSLGLEPHILALSIKWLPFCMTMLGALLAYLIYKVLDNVILIVLFMPYIQIVFAFLNKKWYFDKVYDEVFLVNIMVFGRNITYKVLDGFVFEQIGPEGLRHQVGTLSQVVQKGQSGLIFQYAYIFLLGLTSLLVMSLLSQFGGDSAFGTLIMYLGPLIPILLMWDQVNSMKKG